MYRNTTYGRRAIKLMDAFRNDGYEVSRIIRKFNRIGMVAVSRDACNYDTGQKKKVYYLEGTGYEMGYLLGSLAEDEISSMAVEFADRVVFSFIGSKTLEKIKLLQEALILLIYELSKKAYAELPPEFRDEIKGIYDGCKSSNPKTKINMEHLIALNVGIDVICSMVYTGNFLMRRIPEPKPEDFRIPVMCNAFSVFGRSAGYGHYFGRDFMFPTAEVFQNTAAMIIYNPVSADGKASFPFVGVTAPGMIGSISAMNINRTAIGVDMSPGANCEPQRIGVNSLLLVRLCAQTGDSADGMVDLMRNTTRGVSWNYIIADGRYDKACVVEAGGSGVSNDISLYPPEDVRTLLPSPDFIGSHRSDELKNGMMVRWNDYNYPSEYLGYNLNLWKYFNKKHSANKQIYQDAFSSSGYINKGHGDNNCPSSFYFAPQRENDSNLVIATNHYIIPEMRYYAMHSWTSFIVGDIINDIQWRYDELNRQISDTIAEKGHIDYESAKNLISFLSPYGRNPAYYSGNPKSRDGREIRIEGCTSIFDLKRGTIESHYGYFCDKWIKLTLANYIVGF